MPQMLISPPLMNSDELEFLFSNYQLSSNSVTFNEFSRDNRIFLEPTNTDADTDHLLCSQSGVFLKENCGPGTLTWSFYARISISPSSNWAKGHSFLVQVSNSFAGQTGATLGPSDLGTTCAPTYQRTAESEIDSRVIVSGGSSIFVPDLQSRRQVGYIQLDFYDVEHSISSYTADLNLRSSGLNVKWTPMYPSKINEGS